MQIPEHINVGLLPEHHFKLLLSILPGVILVLLLLCVVLIDSHHSPITPQPPLAGRVKKVAQDVRCLTCAA